MIPQDPICDNHFTCEIYVYYVEGHRTWSFFFFGRIVPGVLYFVFVTNLRISPLYLIFLIYLYWVLGEKHGSKWNYLRKIGDISTVFSTYSPPNNNSLTFAYTLSHPKTPPSKSTTFEKTLKKKGKNTHFPL